ncbi:MAG: LysR family transcriptional regulator [Oscillospiraceae bacterium]|nr:LysR family transcriptional regulator [Oscillospiraceae bacterium]
MRLQQLQCILEVEKHRSISSAARTLYMGQTTLSASIRKLEEELGVVIFDRKSDGVEATEEGKLVLEIADVICAKYARINEIGKNADDSKFVTMYVSIGVEAFLPGMMTRMLADVASDTQLRYQKASSYDLSQLIMNNQFDIAVSHMGTQRREYMTKLSEKYGIHVKELASDRLYLVVRDDHPFAGRKEIEVSELQHMNIVGVQQFRINPKSIAYEQRMGYTNRYTTMPNVALMKRAVLEENMAAIMTGYAAFYDNTMNGDNLQRILLTDRDYVNEIKLCLVYRDAWANSSVGKTVVSCVEQIFRTLDKMD